MNRRGVSLDVETTVPDVVDPSPVRRELEGGVDLDGGAVVDGGQSAAVEGDGG